MCSDEQKQAELHFLKLIAEYLVKQPAIDEIYLIDDAHPYTVDYRERKHLFLWLPATLTLSAEEYGSSSTPAQQWLNVAFRPGTILSTSGQSTLTPIILRHTDEVIP